MEAKMQHILKGSNYYSALRACFLIVKALADVLDKQLSNGSIILIIVVGREIEVAHENIHEKRKTLRSLSS